MAPKVTFNGIELSLSEYDGATASLFNYLDNVITHLESGLDKNDGNFQMSIKADFDAGKAPKHSIHANGTTKRETREKVARILKNSTSKAYDYIAGSVKVNLMVEDK